MIISLLIYTIKALHMVIPNSFFFSFFKGIAILNSIQSIFTSLSLSLSLSHAHAHAHARTNTQKLNKTFSVKSLDMAKRAGRVGFGLGQMGCGSKRVILSGLKNRVAGQVGLTHIFHMIFLFIKKTTCICHLKSHATNYLM